MKRIAYTVIDCGVDGREAATVLYATFDETERDALLEQDESKAWRSKSETIVDDTTAVSQALAKLNGIDRLVLGLSAWPAKTAGTEVK
jgi:hypothetical protein